MMKHQSHIARAGIPLVAALALTLSGCGSSRKLGQPDSDGLIPINVAGSEGYSSATPLFVALKQGFFKQEGLDVNYITLASGATAMAAAIKAGQVDIGIGSAPQWIGNVAQGAVQGKLIGEITDNNYVILGAPGVRSVQQLKGKIFAISSINAGDHLYAQGVLAHYGIDPNAVTWLQMGEPSARISALTTGKVAATELPLTLMPPSLSKSVILGVDDSPVPFVSGAIFARQPLIDANKGVLTRFLAAIGKGADWVRAHPAEAVPICETSGSTEQACKDAIHVALTSKSPYTWSSTSQLNVKGIEGMLPVIGKAMPQVASLKINDLVDASMTPSTH